MKNASLSVDNPDIMRTTLTIDTESPGDAAAPAQPEGGRWRAPFPFPAREGMVATNDMVDALREIVGL